MILSLYDSLNICKIDIFIYLWAIWITPARRHENRPMGWACAVGQARSPGQPRHSSKDLPPPRRSVSGTEGISMLSSHRYN